MKSMVTTPTMELRILSERFLLEGLVLAGMMHFFLIGGIQIMLQHSNGADSLPKIKFNKSIEFVQINGGNNKVLPQISPVRGIRFIEGTPIPIPETEIDPEATIASQTQISSGHIDGDEMGTGTVVSPGITLSDEERPPEPFVAVEKMPLPIITPAPLYPELARRACLEGTVYVKMWVTKEGKVKQAVIAKSTSEIFNQAALNAASGWIFSPAIMNNTPVNAWITVPFRFQLIGR